MRKTLNIKRLRGLLNLTQEDFAKEIDINRGTYANYEAKNKFPEDILLRISTKYSEIIDTNSIILEDPQMDYVTISSLHKRIQELELLNKQKDAIIANQHQVIEMQNQTYLALKQQYENR